jgi:hypothetical protein
MRLKEDMKMRLKEDMKMRLKEDMKMRLKTRSKTDTNPTSYSNKSKQTEIAKRSSSTLHFGHV